MVNKMPSIAKSFENKHSSLEKGYEIQVVEKGYLLFDKEEDYLTMVYLEIIFRDLFKNIMFFQNEEKIIRVIFRMRIINKYLKRLEKIEFQSYYNNCNNFKYKTETPFKKRFYHVWYMVSFDTVKKRHLDLNIWKELNTWQDFNELKKIFVEMTEELAEQNMYLHDLAGKRYELLNPPFRRLMNKMKDLIRFNVKKDINSSLLLFS